MVVAAMSVDILQVEVRSENGWSDTFTANHLVVHLLKPAVFTMIPSMNSITMNHGHS